MWRPRKQVRLMDTQPGNTYWLQNSNDRQPTRPGPGGGRPNGQNPQQRPSGGLNRWLWLLVGVMLALFIFNYINNSNQSTSTPQRVELTYTQFYDQIQQKNIKSATFIGQTDIMGELNTPVNKLSQYHVTQLPNGDDQLPQLLIQNNAKVIYQPPPDNSFWLNLLITFLPWVFLIGLFFFFSRRATQGQQGIFSFGKSRAKLILEDRPSTTFADVAGLDESKYELQEVVEFLKTPTKYQRLGGKIPRGVLLVGPPGTGKTLLARAVAGEAGVPFFSMSGSEFV